MTSEHTEGVPDRRMYALTPAGQERIAGRTPVVVTHDTRSTAMAMAQHPVAGTLRSTQD